MSDLMIGCLWLLAIFAPMSFAAWIIRRRRQAHERMLVARDRARAFMRACEKRVVWTLGYNGDTGDRPKAVRLRCSHCKSPAGEPCRDWLLCNESEVVR